MEPSSSWSQSDKTYFGLFKTVGKFHNDTPRGVTIHYTASKSIGATVKSLSSTKLGYHFIIDLDGTVYQCAGMDERLNHAGRAMWNNTLPNHDHLGVALISWGYVERQPEGHFTSWCGVRIPAGECVKKGGAWWHKATDSQETSLLTLLRSIVGMGVSAKNICGHDECCLPKGRKIDPGGVVDVEKIRSLLSKSVDIVS